MSDTHDRDTSETDDRSDDAITTEPPDPRAGADDSVAKVGEHLQEEADGADSERD